MVVVRSIGIGTAGRSWLVRTRRARTFVTLLPPDVARQITTENVKRIYRLPPSLR